MIQNSWRTIRTSMVKFWWKFLRILTAKLWVQHWRMAENLQQLSLKILSNRLSYKKAKIEKKKTTKRYFVKEFFMVLFVFRIVPREWRISGSLNSETWAGLHGVVNWARALSPGQQVVIITLCELSVVAVRVANDRK